MQKITPCLWFDGEIVEAANFYISVFKDGKIIEQSSYPDDHPTMGGKALVLTLQTRGMNIMLLNGGNTFPQTEAFSFSIDCDDQAETDYFWDALLAGGGKESQCGWLKDKYGVSWQVTPRDMSKYVGGPDKAGAARAMAAMMKMIKLDLATIKRAYEGN